MARPSRVSRIDASPAGRADAQAIKAGRDQTGSGGEASAEFDFAFHGPTANDLHLLKITAFSFAMAVTIVALGHGIAAGILKLF